MIISRTPYRISFFGGGTDYPAWYREHGGSVLATTIDKYCYLTCRYLPPFFEHRYRVVWSRIENCRTVAEIAHPVVRAALELLAPSQGLEIHHVGDLPARSGIGSSSAFTVGLLSALFALEGVARTPEELARDAIDLEQNRLREVVGSQDQVIAVHGGFCRIRFAADGGIQVEPVQLSRARVSELEQSLMLYYSGVRRTAAVIAATYMTDLGRSKVALSELGGLVDEACARLVGNEDLGAFGSLLDHGWQLKKKLGKRVSTSRIDAIYDAARAAGALGGKITGAGGGGFLLLFVPPKRQDAVRAALADLVEVPFRFEPHGSRIIVQTPEEDYQASRRVFPEPGAIPGTPLSRHPVT